MHKIGTAIVLSMMMPVIGGCNAESQLKHYEPDASYGDWVVSQPVSATARLSTEATGGGRSFIGFLHYGCYVDDKGPRERVSLQVTDLMGEFVSAEERGSRLQWGADEIVEQDNYVVEIDVSKFEVAESLRWNVLITTDSARRMELVYQGIDPNRRREEWQAEVVFHWRLQGAVAAISDARQRCGWPSPGDPNATTTTEQ